MVFQAVSQQRRGWPPPAGRDWVRTIGTRLVLDPVDRPVTAPATTAPCENPPSTILVLGQFAAVASTRVLHPYPIENGLGEHEPVREVAAGLVVDRVTSTDLGAACARTASTNAWPTPPTPGGSPVPRANTTSYVGTCLGRGHRNRRAPAVPRRRHYRPNKRARLRPCPSVSPFMWALWTNSGLRLVRSP